MRAPRLPTLRGLHRLQPTEAATGRSLEKAAEGSTYGRSLLYSIPPSLAPTHSQILKPWPKDLVLFTAGERSSRSSRTPNSKHSSHRQTLEGKDHERCANGEETGWRDTAQNLHHHHWSGRVAHADTTFEKETQDFKRAEFNTR